jgi:peptide/nickel transport system ATP-binding protein
MALFETVWPQPFFASPRLRGEADARSAAGEGDSPRVQLSPSSPRAPLTLTLSPQAGRGERRN